MSMSILKAVSRIASFSLAGLMFVPGVSQASHYIGQCATQLNAVELSINTAHFLGNRATTDRSNMLAKLDAVNAKISLLKYSDAVDKLMDISDTATALASATKPKLDDATAINDSVAAAIGCVGTLR